MLSWAQQASSQTIEWNNSYSGALGTYDYYHSYNIPTGEYSRRTYNLTEGTAASVRTYQPETNLHYNRNQHLANRTETCGNSGLGGGFGNEYDILGDGYSANCGYNSAFQGSVVVGTISDRTYTLSNQHNNQFKTAHTQGWTGQGSDVVIKNRGATNNNRDHADLRLLAPDAQLGSSRHAADWRVTNNGRTVKKQYIPGSQTDGGFGPEFGILGGEFDLFSYNPAPVDHADGNFIDSNLKVLKKSEYSYTTTRDFTGTVNECRIFAGNCQNAGSATTSYSGNHNYTSSGTSHTTLEMGLPAAAAIVMQKFPNLTAGQVEDVMWRTRDNSISLNATSSVRNWGTNK